MTWLQTAAGRAFDLVNPTSDMVDFETDIPVALAHIARFTGHAKDYSVAQHCVLGADYLWRETEDAALALAFLLHDAHEAYCGDMATPIAQALAAHGNLEFPLGDQIGVGVGHFVAGALERQKYVLDIAIHAAARVPFPLPHHHAARVKEIDLRMLATERKHLLGPSPRPWHASVEAAIPLEIDAYKWRPWPAEPAADMWRHDFKLYRAHLDEARAKNPSRMEPVQ